MALDEHDCDGGATNVQLLGEIDPMLLYVPVHHKQNDEVRYEICTKKYYTGAAPEGQPRQESIDEPPEATLYVLLGHAWQVGPGSALKVPTGHNWQFTVALAHDGEDDNKPNPGE